MTQLFRDRRRFDGTSSVRFWAETVWDVARTAPALRVEALRAPLLVNTQSREEVMKPMAILMVLVGLIQVVNAWLEARAGISNAGSAYSFTGVGLGVGAAMLLIVAGIALFRRGWGAAGWATAAAIGCVALVLSIRFIAPWMSVFASLLGIGVPIVLLIFLFVARRSGPSERTTA
jgi:hypothetical protein